MITQETIEEFFADHFKNTSAYLISYKDKQLIKNGQFRKYAEKRIRESKVFLRIASIGMIIFAYYTVIGFTDYGADPNWLNLGFGMSAFLAFFLFSLYSAKYYTFKISMLFLSNSLINKRN